MVDLVKVALMVAPHTGAWIETHGTPISPKTYPQVAPHTGAWIETVPLCARLPSV